MLVFGKSGKAAVGLDIGSHSIKVVELARAGKNLKMTRYAIQELAPGTVVDGEVVNREHLISTITDVLRNAGIKSKNVYTAVSGRSVIVRRIPMEKMSRPPSRSPLITICWRLFPCSGWEWRPLRWSETTLVPATRMVR